MTGRRGAPRWIAAAALPVLASLGGLGTGCHAREFEPAPKPAAGTYPLDGSYLFAIDYREGTRTRLITSGHFVIADSQIVSFSRACEVVDPPRASAGNAEAWFRCAMGFREYVELRFNLTDPINRSRWYANLRIVEPVPACARYAANGNCVLMVTTYASKYVSRSGGIDVQRGLPAPPPDGPAGSGEDRTRRARCDTVKTASCSGV
jgi:hypothetical protein